MKLRKLEPFILLEDDSEQHVLGRRPPARKRAATSGSRTASGTTNTNASRYIVDGPDADQYSSMNSSDTASIMFIESSV